MTGLISSFSTVVSIIIAFVGVVGVLYFVYGAFMLMMSGGNAQKAETGKQAMVQALIGVALVLVAFTVVNTVTSLVGSSGGAVQVGQVAGRDSVSLEAPSVVSVTAKANATPGAAYVVVTFSEPVYVSGTVAVSVRNRGVIRCINKGARTGDHVSTKAVDASDDYGCPDTVSSATNVLLFGNNDTGGDADTMALTANVDVVEKFALGRGATIRDVDGNPALYAFQPVIAE